MWTKNWEEQKRPVAFLFFCVTLILLPGPPNICSAQERQMGGVGITVFTDQNFRGKSESLIVR